MIKTICWLTDTTLFLQTPFSRFASKILKVLLIKKYFFNLNHNILKNIIRSKIKDKDAINILDTIIDSTNHDYINKEIIKIKNREISKLEKSNSSNKDKLIKAWFFADGFEGLLPSDATEQLGGDTKYQRKKHPSPVHFVEDSVLNFLKVSVAIHPP